MSEAAAEIVAPQARKTPLILMIVLSFAGTLAGLGGGVAALKMGVVDLAPPKHEEAKAKPKSAEPPTYVELPRAFTSNLRDTGRYVQLSLGVAMTGGSKGEEAMKTHDVAVRSAVLETLATQSDADISSPDGKRRLRAQLVKALNAALGKGESQVTDAYFTALVIQ